MGAGEKAAYGLSFADANGGGVESVTVLPETATAAPVRARKTVPGFNVTSEPLRTA